MPLIKSSSKQALKKNIETEMKSNPDKKDRAQNLAIALHVQRANKKKMALGGDMRPPKEQYMGDRMAKGGEVYSLEESEDIQSDPMKDDEYGSMPEEDMEPMVPRRKMDDRRPPVDEYMASRFAKGGIAESIMRKRRMAEGGEVDLEANSEESPNMEDQYSYDANGEEQYDLRQLSKQPMDSNEMGDDREDESENKNDMISAIRMKLKAKRGM